MWIGYQVSKVVSTHLWNTPQATFTNRLQRDSFHNWLGGLLGLCNIGGVLQFSWKVGISSSQVCSYRSINDSWVQTYRLMAVQFHRKDVYIPWKSFFWRMFCWMFFVFLFQVAILWLSGCSWKDCTFTPNKRNCGYIKTTKLAPFTSLHCFLECQSILLQPRKKKNCWETTHQVFKLPWKLSS